MDRASRRAHQDDAIGIAAMLGRMTLEPVDDRRDILRPGRPAMVGGKAIIDDDAQEPGLSRHPADIGIGPGVGAALIAFQETAAMDED